MAVVFSNCGFMGIPVAYALLGSASVIWVSLYVVVFQLFTWTVGVTFFQSKGSILKALLNPGVGGIVVGLILYGLNVNLPVMVSTPIDTLAMLNTPLAMVIIGGFLAGVSLRPQKGDGRMWLAISFRLVIMPMIMLGLAVALGLRNDVMVAVMIPAAAPIAATAILLPAMFGGDVDLASRMTQLSNLASAITMPLIIALSQLLLT
jgi:hypothetical protein